MYWQPIETAPKDGARILLWGGHDAVIGYWQDGTKNGWPTGWRTGIFVSTGGYTHWMPLPEAPSSAQQQAAGEP